MSIIDDNHAVLWTWDDPVPYIAPSQPAAAHFHGYRLALVLALGLSLAALLTLAALVVLGAI